jgi:hypothetical protein
VTILTCKKKRRPTILLAHEKPYTNVTRIATATAAHTSATNIVPLRSSIAAGVRHKPLRQIEVTMRTCHQKRCVAILLTHEKQYTSIMRIDTDTAAHKSATNIAPLQSSIAAGVRHKPPRHIEVTIRTCHQKRRPTILLAHEKPYTSVRRIASATAAHTSATDIVPLRSSIAAGVRHKPLRNLKMAVPARRQQRSAAALDSTPQHSE